MKKKINTPAYLFLQKCLKIMEDRYQQYGDYRQNIDNTIKLLKNEGEDLKAEQVLKVLLATKGARQLYGTKEDSFIDDINYRAMLYSYYLNSK